MMEKFMASSNNSNLVENFIGPFENLVDFENKKYGVTNVTDGLSSSDFGLSFTWGIKVVFCFLFK